MGGGKDYNKIKKPSAYRVNPRHPVGRINQQINQQRNDQGQTQNGNNNADGDENNVEQGNLRQVVYNQLVRDVRQTARRKDNLHKRLRRLQRKV